MKAFFQKNYQAKLIANLSNDNAREKYETFGDCMKETNKIGGKVMRRKKSDNTLLITNKKEMGRSKSFQRSSSKSNGKTPDKLYLDDIQVLSNTETFFSHNVWYYGKLDLFQTDSTEVKLIAGTLLVRIDRYGSVAYNLTYLIDNELHTCRFPFENGKYSLNFDDPAQPRFLNVSSLIAYMVENNYLERVTFEWLIDNY
nr:uncharacterized protein LOC124814763 [Hydra vulgaris]